MTQQTHVLIDAANSIVCTESYRGRAATGEWSVRQRTLRGGRSEGVQVVELDNGAMCIDVLPTRGMGIWRVRRGQKTLGWQAPAVNPVHPSFVPLMEPAGLGWLDGFNELLCRCGLESNGPPEFDDAGRLLRPLHGQIANTPAHHVDLVVDDQTGRISVTGVVDECRFHFQSLRLTTTISTTIGSNEFAWHDEVENVGGRDALLQMLYHFNIGQPLLRAGSTIVAPVATAAPLTQIAAGEGIEQWNIMPPPRPGSNEQVYVLDLAADSNDETHVLIKGLSGDDAVGLKLNKRALPCFTVWRNTPDERDGYVLGIEPGTNYPNPRTFEKKQRRVVELKPGAVWQAKVSATWHSDGRTIEEDLQAIQAIQKRRQPELANRPLAHMSASASAE